MLLALGVSGLQVLGCKVEVLVFPYLVRVLHGFVRECELASKGTDN